MAILWVLGAPAVIRDQIVNDFCWGFFFYLAQSFPQLSCRDEWTAEIIHNSPLNLAQSSIREGEH